MSTAVVFVQGKVVGTSIASYEVTGKIRNDGGMGGSSRHSNWERGDLENLKFISKC